MNDSYPKWAGPPDRSRSPAECISRCVSRSYGSAGAVTLTVMYSAPPDG